MIQYCLKRKVKKRRKEIWRDRVRWNKIQSDQKGNNRKDETIRWNKIQSDKKGKNRKDKKDTMKQDTVRKEGKKRKEKERKEIFIDLLLSRMQIEEVMDRWIKTE